MPTDPVGDAQDAAERFQANGDLTAALAVYETALAAAPDHPDLLAGIAALAERMDLMEVAAAFWARVQAAAPDRLAAVDGQARALRALGRFEAAVEVLRPALLAHPQEPGLWNSLGVTLTQQGQPEAALTFLDEAIRLDAASAVALYNRANALIDLDRLDAAAADMARARRAARRPADIAMIDFAGATLALAAGELAAGWDAYEARLSPDMPRPVSFDASGRRWTPDMGLEGRQLLILAEQGVGDEIMFAGVLPQVLEALGPGGGLSLAVDARLVDLFTRSFPAVEVTASATEHQNGRLIRSAPRARAPADLWAPMGSLPRRFRRVLADFPDRDGYLTPDPARVAFWRDWLGQGPPAVGLSWRSGKASGDRRRLYPPLDAWAPLLARPDLRFVNLQYGEVADDLAVLRDLGGKPILEAPGIDLREDLDDLAALCAALSRVVSVGNATAQLAGACGCPTVMICAPTSWPRLGSAAYPWHPSVTAVAPEAPGEWGPTLALTAQLVEFAK